MVAHHLGLVEVALVGPLPRGLLPKDLEQTDAVHRLVPQDS
jgi:hypothetical protein